MNVMSGSALTKLFRAVFDLAWLGLVIVVSVGDCCLPLGVCVRGVAWIGR